MIRNVVKKKITMPSIKKHLFKNIYNGTINTTCFNIIKLEVYLKIEKKMGDSITLKKVILN
jgi:hypothetical protein